MRTNKKTSSRPRKRKAPSVPKSQRIVEALEALGDVPLAQVREWMYENYKLDCTSSEVSTARRKVGIAPVGKGLDKSLTVEKLLIAQEFVNACGSPDEAIQTIKALQKVGERLGARNGS